MAACETALAKKLGVTEGGVLALVNAPDGIPSELPPKVVVRRQPRGKADVVLAFFTDRVDLERRLDSLGRMVFPAGGLWIAWPKKTSGVTTDVSDHLVRDLALARGLVDNTRVRRRPDVDGPPTGLASGQSPRSAVMTRRPAVRRLTVPSLRTAPGPGSAGGGRLG